MKKFLCVLTVLCLLFCLAACGGSDGSGDDGAESSESESSEEEQESEEVSEEESEEESEEDFTEEQTESASESETEIEIESETETEESETVKTGTSVTQETFELITSLTRSNLNYNAAHDYNYDGFQFTEDISELLAEGDKTTSVPPRAFYVRIAELIEEYLESGTFSSSYAAYIFGYEVSEEEFAAKVEDLSAHIVSSNALKPIVTKLESISNVTVTDTDSGYTVIVIELHRLHAGRLRRDRQGGGVRRSGAAVPELHGGAPVLGRVVGAGGSMISESNSLIFLRFRGENSLIFLRFRARISLIFL